MRPRAVWVELAEPVALIVSASLLVLALIGLGGCAASPQAVAVAASNSARAVGEDAAFVLKALCVEGMNHAAEHEDADLYKRLEAVCDPSVKTYIAYKASWTALAAAVQAAELGGPSNAAELSALVQRMAIVASQISLAMQAVQAVAK